MKLINTVLAAAALSGVVLASGQAAAWQLVTNGDGELYCLDGACSDYSDVWQAFEYDCLDVTDQGFFSSCDAAVSGGTGGVVGSDLLDYAALHDGGLVGPVGQIEETGNYTISILPNGQIGVVLGQDPVNECKAVDGGATIQADQPIINALKHLADKAATLPPDSCTTTKSVLNAASLAQDKVSDSCLGYETKTAVVKLGDGRAAMLSIEPVTSAIRSIAYYSVDSKSPESFVVLARSPKSPSDLTVCTATPTQPVDPGPVSRWICEGGTEAGSACNCRYQLFGITWATFSGVVIYDGGQRYCEGYLNQ